MLKDCRKAYRRARAREAVVACGKALALKPDSAEIMTILANAELDRGKNAEALAWADKAIAIDPANSDAYLVAGAVQQQVGKRAEAKRAYEKYLEFAPRGKYAEDVRALLESL